MISNTQTYLGDGLYAILHRGMIELRANDIDNPSDTIYLEPNVLVRLIDFAETQNFILTD